MKAIEPLLQFQSLRNILQRVAAVPSQIRDLAFIVVASLLLLTSIMEMFDCHESPPFEASRRIDLSLILQEAQADPTMITPHKYTLKDEEVESCLQELDDTVASLEGRDPAAPSSSPKKPGRSEHDEGSSISSVVTERTHAVLMHRHLIDNIESITSPHRRSCGSRKSSSSKRSKRSLAQQSTRTGSSSLRRPRGPSLERTVFQTLLHAARSDGADSHFSSDASEASSTESILKDLHQADAVWSVEVGRLLPPLATEEEPDLLFAPCFDWQPVDFEAVQFPSPPSPPLDQARSVSPPTSHFSHSDDPFGSLDTDGDAMTPGKSNTPSLPTATTVEGDSDLFFTNDFGSTNDVVTRQNEDQKQSPPSPGAHQDVPTIPTTFSQESWFVSSSNGGGGGGGQASDWMSFGEENPFFSSSVAKSGDDSVASPSSVVAFRMVDRLPTQKSGDDWSNAAEGWVSTKCSF
jgi:hypothetical protein